MLNAGSPLSSQQERLWRLMQLDDAQHYCTQSAILLEGALDKDRLRRSVESIVGRHEILRTVLVHPGELVVPLQVVTDNFTPAWRETNIARKSIDDFLKEEWNETGDALRICLVELDPNKHVLIATLPALCADQRSLSIIHDELIDCYASSSLDQKGEILQYADYAAWQHELLAEDDQEGNSSNTAYWRERLQESISGANLPFENRALEVRTEPPISFSFDSAETKLIDDVARRYEVSRSVVLLAYWQTLLWRLTGKSEVVVGGEFDGRNFSELEGAVGLLARFLPIRVDRNDRTRFSEHVTRLQQVVAPAWRQPWIAVFSAQEC